MKTLSVAAASAALLAAFAPSSTFADTRKCPDPVPLHIPMPDLVSPWAKLVPDEVCIPEPMRPPMNLAYFDDYSWRAFIALVWPALAGSRGEPDPKGKLEQPLHADAKPNGPPLVFETYKAEWETFPANDQAIPKGWNDPDDLQAPHGMWTGLPNACAMQAKPGDFFLAPFTRFGPFENVRQAGALAYVLVAQNGTLVRYLAGYNKKTYDYILNTNGGLYLARNLPKDYDHRLEFPFASVTVKSSWIDLGRVDEKPKVANPETYHRRIAWLFDPFVKNEKNEPQCEQHVVGLIGLHIVQKTPNHPAWVWSSFEHQKTAPERVGSKPLGSPADTPITCPTPSKPMSPYSLRDESHIPMNDVPRSYWLQDWDDNPPPCTPPPVNIERTRRINDSTTATNTMWRDKLRKNGSVWQYYRLVLTQWSTARSCPNWGCGDPGFTVPGNGTLPTSAVANVTMETWLQDDLSIASRQRGAPPPGCMACHNKVANSKFTGNLDFVFSLRINGYPSKDAYDSPSAQSLRAPMRTLSTAPGDPAPSR
jgi:hypothetical protein